MAFENLARNQIRIRINQSITFLEQVDGDLSLIGARADELGGSLPPAEGVWLPGETETYRVDDGGLAGAIGADDDVEVGPGFEGDRDVLHEVGQGHAGDGSRDHRPDRSSHATEFEIYSLEPLEYFF